MQRRDKVGRANHAPIEQYIPPSSALFPHKHVVGALDEAADASDSAPGVGLFQSRALSLHSMAAAICVVGCDGDMGTLTGLSQSAGVDAPA